MKKEVQQKIINRLVKLEILGENYQVFFPLIHRDGLNSILVEPVTDTIPSQIIQIKDGSKRLFFGFREVE